MRKAFFQLHIAVFLAGFTAVLGELITLNESLLVWYRLLITVIVLGTILFFTKQLKRIPLVETLKIFGVGLVVALHWIAFYGSVKYANISVGVVCISASGFFTAFLEPLILRKKIIFVEVLLGLIAIVGIYIIFDFHPQFKLGIIFGIISAMLSAIFPIFNKQLLVRHSPKLLTFYELTGGLIGASLIAPFYLMNFTAKYYLPTSSDWLWLLVLSLFCTVLAFDLQLNVLRKISTFTANLSYSLEPIYGIILAFIFFHENEFLTSWFYVGLALIIGAVILQMLRVMRSRYKMQVKEK